MSCERSGVRACEVGLSLSHAVAMRAVPQLELARRWSMWRSGLEPAQEHVEEWAGAELRGEAIWPRR